MSKLNIAINHNSDSVDIVEADNAFDTFDSEERKSSVKIFKDELIKELAQLPYCPGLEVPESSIDFKIPFSDLGFIELWWLSDNPVYGTIVISCDHELSRKAMKLVVQILEKITQKNSELYVLE